MFEDLLYQRQGGDEMLLGRGETHLSEVTDRTEWEQKAEDLREIYRTLLGEPAFPAVDAESRVVKEEIWKGLIRREYSFLVGPGERTTGVALMAKDLDARRVAVLTHHSSLPGGKGVATGEIDAGRPSLAYGEYMARRGYVSFSYDQLGAGSRVMENAAPFDNAAFCQKYPAWSGRGRDLYDLSQALQVVRSIPEVDPQKIASMGHSQGGGLTLDAMIFEPTIRAGFSNCGGAPFRTSINPFGMARDRWWIGIPRLRPFFRCGKLAPIDFHEKLALIAPRPLMVVSAANEKCYGVGPDMETNERHMKELHDQVGRVYAIYGKRRSFQGIIHRKGHSLDEPQLGVWVGFLKESLG